METKAMRIEIVNPQAVILEELKDKRMAQKDIALTYAFIMRQERDSADWPTINRAIMDRWKGKTALTRVKEMAWKFMEGK